MNKIPFIEKNIYRNIERLTFNENSLKLNMYFTLSSSFNYPLWIFNLFE